MALAVVPVWALFWIEDMLWSRGLDGPSDTIGLLALVLIVLLFLPVLSVTVRRFHDVGLSGWWVLALWGGAFALEAVRTTRQAVTALAEDPLRTPAEIRIDPVFIALSAAIILVYIVEFVICVWPGTSGPNRFGSPPDARTRDRPAEVFQ